MSRILFSLTPITGHVRPALPLVRALVDAGHDVVVCTGSKFADAVRAAGATAAPVVHGRDLDDAALDDWAREHHAPEPGVKRLQWDVTQHFLAPVPGYLQDLEDVVAQGRPDVVVLDTTSVAGALLAQRHGIPSVQVTVTPLPVSSRDTAPFGTGLQPPRTALQALRYRLLDAVVKRVVFRAAQRRALALVAEVGLPRPEGFFLDWMPTFATRVLHTSVPSMEYPRSDLPGTVETVGAILPRGVDAFDPPAWWDELPAARAAGRPVVLVTQGTVATDPARLLLPALEALADLDALVVVTTGTAEPQDVLPRLAPHVRAARFVPFDRLLPHVDVMVTNGGFGGVQQALAAGVPLVVAGRTEDKAEVAARVAWAGVGVALPTDRRTDATTARAVADGVRRVLGDASFARRAGEVAREYARYDAVGRVVEVVEELAWARQGERTAAT
ncbi:glycosyltransferase [Cellulomonas fimi]|uniref:Glycosyltransferase, MGT family n=1 Tax=Cellulomonas fimi (strain ATCC 484 / DSM 20113 / JCM 1341 / CCUG 24087 / LMG 16345 / NBRC 15513 / NCIMB 8980 / NCTC 7547 / NRS-133) TaxID=590998 RepID=F4H5W3_CELFA|nr:nucleotide disphospho-sugar-binding domain-containing protein [Cellulomonas fimi]AEE45563.1 glycosyltransferase, MGT family [Cellulomonas fimi ATCC 484]NNH05926.1 glycosyltransferase [Cellulomonas fimi]VEH29873.1 PGL/p-HBAD biosynthesis rhamnosyltransferase [Cellulomonas fimi]